MKVYLCDALKRYDFVCDKDKDKQNIQALKTGNCYRVITSEQLKFLDASNFLAAGTSLDKWLKAYKYEAQKAIFPYEWMIIINQIVLDYFFMIELKLLDYDFWYSSLKNKMNQNYSIMIYGIHH